MQKKEELWRKWPLESGTSRKPVLCNDVKPGRVCEKEGHVRKRLVQTKNQRAVAC